MAIAAVVGVVAATAYSVHEQSVARREQRQANERSARIEAVKGQRERANALRQNRITQASVFAQGANAGVQGSSGVQGTLASFGTQAAVNFDFANNIDTLNQQRLSFINRAEGAQTRAGYGQQAAGLATSLYGLKGG